MLLWPKMRPHIVEYIVVLLRVDKCSFYMLFGALLLGWLGAVFARCCKAGETPVLQPAQYGVLEPGCDPNHSTCTALHGGQVCCGAVAKGRHAPCCSRMCAVWQSSVLQHRSVRMLMVS